MYNDPLTEKIVKRIVKRLIRNKPSLASIKNNGQILKLLKRIVVNHMITNNTSFEHFAQASKKELERLILPPQKKNNLIY